MPVSSSQSPALSDNIETFFKNYQSLQPSKNKSSDFVKNPDFSEMLVGFFKNYQELQIAKDDYDFLTDNLAEFFTNYQQIKVEEKSSLKEAPKSLLEIDRLASWFADMQEPIISARRGAFSCDPWKVAALGEDEVRNSSVLAWLINPRESHGLGSCVLESILAQVNRFSESHGRSGLPESPGQFCRVRTEISPNGDDSSRFDIEIEDEKFYLVIEVKINALESDGQVERYGRIAEVQAATRPWKIIFLTRRGGDSQTAGKYFDNTIPLSFSALSKAALARVRDTVKAYDGHRSKDQILAECMVLRFLQSISQF